MILANIRKALEQHLAALSPAWQTFYEATLNEPSLTVNHQEVTTIFGQAVSDFVFGGPIRHVGIFQVMVCTPHMGGPNDADERVAAVQAHFKRGTQLTVSGLTQKLWVPDQPGVAAPIFTATWRRVPVTIGFNALEPG